MGIIFKHSFRILWVSFLLTTLVIAAVAWLIKSPQLLEIVLSHGVPLKTFIILSFYRMPSFLELLLPISFLFATLYTLHHLTISSELIAMRAAGHSHLAVAKPVLTLAIIVSIFSFFLTFYASPSGYRTVRDLQHYVGANILLSPIRTGEFTRIGQDIILYIPEQTEKGIRKGLFIHDSRKKEKEITLMATEGQLQKTPQGVRFKLVNGKRQEFSTQDQQLAEFAFDYYVFDLDIQGHKTQKRTRRIEERYLNELQSHEEAITEHERKAFRNEIHRRILLPFSIIAYALLALALFSARGMRRGDSGGLMVRIASLAIATHVMLLSFSRLNSKIAYFSVVAYGVLSLMSLFSFAYLWRPVPFDRMINRWQNFLSKSRRHLRRYR